jgi:hypothetical protein
LLVEVLAEITTQLIQMVVVVLEDLSILLQ